MAGGPASTTRFAVSVPTARAGIPVCPFRLVIFDAFNTLVTSRAGSRDTFLAGLRRVCPEASPALLTELQAACEGLDHSPWSVNRRTYVRWAKDSLRQARSAHAPISAEL